MLKKVGALLLAAIMVIAAGCGTAKTNTAEQKKEDSKTLVVAAYGGSFEKGMKETIIPEFEKKYNVKVTYVTGVSTDTLAKLQAQKDKPQIDVAIMDDGPQAQAKSFGLLAPLDTAKVTNLANIYNISKDSDNIGVGIGIVATGLSYDSKVFKEKGWAAPESWNDLGKPEYKGKLVLPSFSNTYGVHMLVMLAKANGGSEKNIEPGFTKLKEIAKNATTFDKTADVSNYFLQGETVISAWSTSRTFTLKAKNFPIDFVYPKEGTVGMNAMASIVKNAPNPELANEFINFILGEDAQKTISKTVFFGPVNKNVKLDQDVASKVVYGEEQINKLLKIDWKTINENRAAWSERINKEIEIAH
jgi:putative spermidine/putrescine transport system substrate-binding protein